MRMCSRVHVAGKGRLGYCQNLQAPEVIEDLRRIGGERFSGFSWKEGNLSVVGEDGQECSIDPLSTGAGLTSKSWTHVVFFSQDAFLVKPQDSSFLTMLFSIAIRSVDRTFWIIWFIVWMLGVGKILIFRWITIWQTDFMIEPKTNLVMTSYIIQFLNIWLGLLKLFWNCRFI